MKIEKLIDHTLLKSDASAEQIKKICAEARQYGFMSVCVNPARVELVHKELEGSGVKTCCVIGFPLGATLSSVKAFEAQEAIKLGAEEVDMVINIGAVKDGNWELVESDICAVVEAASGKALVKVIIETCLLTDEEKIKACECAMRAKADFVKTSTGFSTAGATEHDVKLMRSVVGDSMGVKASGGVRTPEDAEKFIAAGASRLGTSNGVKLLG
ncbi:MAG: deoxyribose-phosphate aldolase [Clostridiales bacterium]|nr:deoxyribose-phosphate aldolase [Clostridiales bacterium]MDY2925676.1 deoxyribose-phosphate aldolase [Eubacteriales bacterium]MDD7489339.1 deoxyribose-phosphate aldolase [Clostridiales bacterium]MDD7522513.1 deoxyribose-phosphate aldolase [Clostridiales bacterium]MDD7688198.1 deoxyribose-phosphate aldolase [Clostridiales bacterium]